MNPEKILEPIKTEDIAERRHLIEHKINIIQFSFAEEKHKRIIEDQRIKDKPIFSDTLKKYTKIFNDLKINYLDIVGDERGLDVFLEIISKKINETYEKHTEFWEEEIIKYLYQQVLNLKPFNTDTDAYLNFGHPAISNSEYLGINIDFEKIVREQKVGAVKYILRMNDKPSSQKRKIGEHVIFQFEPYLEIHVDSFFEQKSDDSTVESVIREITKSFQKLAVEIVRNKIPIVGIYGESWLLDTAIARRAGFITEPFEGRENHTQYNSGGFWAQFVDQNGQINRKRFTKLLETGQAAHNIMAGFISIEDFLNKYLPDELRGEVEIMEPDRDVVNIFIDFNKRKQRFKETLADQKINYEKTVEELKKNDIISTWMATDDGRTFFKLIREIKRQNIDWRKKTESLIVKQLMNHKTIVLSDIIDDFKKRLFKSKKITII